MTTRQDRVRERVVVGPIVPGQREAGEARDAIQTEIDKYRGTKGS